MYDAVYSQNIGLCGFRCRVGACTRVVRSYKGIVMHCKRKHGLVAQMKLFDTEAQKENKNGEETSSVSSEPVRVTVCNAFAAIDGGGSVEEKRIKVE